MAQRPRNQPLLTRRTFLSGLAVAATAAVMERVGGFDFLGDDKDKGLPMSVPPPLGAAAATSPAPSTRPSAAASSPQPAASSAAPAAAPTVAAMPKPPVQADPNYVRKSNADYFVQLAQEELAKSARKEQRSYGFNAPDLIDCVSFIVMLATKYQGGNTAGAYNWRKDGGVNVDKRYNAVENMVVDSNKYFNPLVRGVDEVALALQNQSPDIQPGDILMMNIGLDVLAPGYGTGGQTYDHFMVFTGYEKGKATFIAATGKEPPGKPNENDGIATDPNCVVKYTTSDMSIYNGSRLKDLAIKRWKGLEKAPVIAQVREEAKSIVEQGFANYLSETRNAYSGRS